MIKSCDVTAKVNDQGDICVQIASKAKRFIVKNNFNRVFYYFEQGILKDSANILVKMDGKILKYD